MKNKGFKYLITGLIISSCATTNPVVDKREYKKSKPVASYTGMANELQDAHLVLKENGYFKFYQKIWLVVSIKQGESVGKYLQMNDTIYLNWPDKDPRQIKPYLSKKCVIDPATKNLWFIDELSNQRLWELRNDDLAHPGITPK